MAARAYLWPAAWLLLAMQLAPVHVAAEGGKCDMARAEKVLQQCQVCHSVEAGAPNLTGPNLHGILNRPAASLEGFAYSPVLRKSGLVWDSATLDRFLAAPQELLPYNRMAFGGVTNDEDRTAIVCLLSTLN